jgi:diaminopimelate decarboxylase
VTPVEPSPGFLGRLAAEAGRLGTPFYAYDGERLDSDAGAIRAAFPSPRWTRLYSIKANLSPGVIARIAGNGFGVSAVSRGEAALALKASVPADDIVLEGVGKSDSDVRFAVDMAAAGRPLKWVSLESADDASALSRAARRRLKTGPRIDVLVRVNPEVEPETHHGLAVGARGSKFGVLAEELPAVMEAGGGPAGPLRWRGIHVHVGSQLRSTEAWTEGIRVGLDCFERLRETLPDFDTLDAGGGLPADPFAADTPSPEAFARAAEGAIDSASPDHRPTRLAIEPGRAVVAASGWLVARVLVVRERPERGHDIPASRMVVLDAGMTELIRPALYGAEHPFFAITSWGKPAAGLSLTTAIVDGPVCESTDRFGLVALPPLRRGDLVAIGHAGAYGSAMSSNYNGRPRAPEIMLEPDGSVTLLRRRGSQASLG